MLKSKERVIMQEQFWTNEKGETSKQVTTITTYWGLKQFQYTTMQFALPKTNVDAEATFPVA